MHFGSFVAGPLGVPSGPLGPQGVRWRSFGILWASLGSFVGSLGGRVASGVASTISQVVPGGVLGICSFHFQLILRSKFVMLTWYLF